MKLNTTASIIVGIVIAGLNLHADFLSCQMQLKHAMNTHQTGEKYTEKKNISVLKYTAKKFQKHLKRARTKCVDLEEKPQIEANKKLTELNRLEEKFIKMGILKSSM